MYSVYLSDDEEFVSEEDDSLDVCFECFFLCFDFFLCCFFLCLPMQAVNVKFSTVLVMHYLQLLKLDHRLQDYVYLKS